MLRDDEEWSALGDEGLASHWSQKIAALGLYEALGGARPGARAVLTKSFSQRISVDWHRETIESAVALVQKAMPSLYACSFAELANTASLLRNGDGVYLGIRLEKEHFAVYHLVFSLTVHRLGG